MLELLKGNPANEYHNVALSAFKMVKIVIKIIRDIVLNTTNEQLQIC